MSTTYKAYMLPFGRVKWTPDNADVPYFGKLLGTRCGTAYALQKDANLADFLWAIGRAPWLLPDGFGRANVEVTVPSCEGSGRPADITQTFAVMGERHLPLHKTLGGKFGILLAALLISNATAWTMKFFVELIGIKCFGLIASSASVALLMAIGGLLVAAAAIALIALINLFYGRGRPEQPKIAS
ncbi:MAG: hypothetical protein LBB38_01860 [Puniceicoccales bacterium]|nr:hypothetical protein [Puniceicoccales bacterium]